MILMNITSGMGCHYDAHTTKPSGAVGEGVNPFLLFNFAGLVSFQLRNARKNTKGCAGL